MKADHAKFRPSYKQIIHTLFTNSVVFKALQLYVLANVMIFIQNNGIECKIIEKMYKKFHPVYLDNDQFLFVLIKLDLVLSTRIYLIGRGNLDKLNGYRLVRN